LKWGEYPKKALMCNTIILIYLTILGGLAKFID
jgi:hypothetical protein